MTQKLKESKRSWGKDRGTLRGRVLQVCGGWSRVGGTFPQGSPWHHDTFNGERRIWSFHVKKMSCQSFDGSVCLLKLKHLVSVQARTRPSVQAELDLHATDVQWVLVIKILYHSETTTSCSHFTLSKVVKKLSWRFSQTQDKKLVKKLKLVFSPMSPVSEGFEAYKIQNQPKIISGSKNLKKTGTFHKCLQTSETRLHFSILRYSISPIHLMCVRISPPLV